MTTINVTGIGSGTYDAASDTFTITVNQTTFPADLSDDVDGAPDGFVTIGTGFSEIFLGDDQGDLVLIAFKTDAMGDVTHVVGQYTSVTPEGAFNGISVGDIYIYGIGSQNTGTVTGFTDTAGAAALFCFVHGTRIATETGERRVEDLMIGEAIATACGRAVPVKWIGRQTVHKLFAGSRIQPVRIQAGALGDGLPHNDLTVTADHGMVIDGLVINASALINGTTIDWVPMTELPDRVTYFHVETEDHDVILANGAPAETFIDIPGRRAFDNYQEYLDLYGAERIVAEMDRPRITSARLVPEAIKTRLRIEDHGIRVGQPLSA